MTVHRTSPDGMFQPVPYDHVAIGSGSRLVAVAGQIARDGDGNAVGGDDLAQQTAQVIRNAARGLAGAGATFDDVTRMRFFVARFAPEHYAAFAAGVELVRDEVGLPDPMPPASLIGVDLLFQPDVLVELEVDAIVD
jgi:enamine deaminase RidA (YjgF/YER057c/UK114 family)